MKAEYGELGQYEKSYFDVPIQRIRNTVSSLYECCTE